MDFFFLIIVAVVLSVIGSVFWWVVVIWIGAKAVSAASRQINSQLVDLERLARQAAHAPASGGGALHPQFQRLLFEAQRNIKTLEGLQRARYETRVAEITGIAANAGIDLRR